MSGGVYLSAECVPPCVNGTCDVISGICECDIGYIGNTCVSCKNILQLEMTNEMTNDNYFIACPVGMFGENCSQGCHCVAEHESSPCENTDGTCHCLPGYTGPSCEQGTSGTPILASIIMSLSWQNRLSTWYIWCRMLEKLFLHGKKTWHSSM